MISFNSAVGLLAFNLFFSAPSSWSQSCNNLFQQNELHETKFELTEKQVKSTSAVQIPSLDSTIAVNEILQKLLQSTILKFLPVDSRFALNLSHLNKIHLVSAGLTSIKHQELLTFLQASSVEQILLGVPPLFRNRYFEVEVRSHGTKTTRVEVVPKLAWDLKIPLESQIISGFASEPTEKIRPYSSTSKNPTEKIRLDLLIPRFTQETFATCGIASIIKVFKRRNIKYRESELLKFVEANGVREIEKVFGPDPGLSLSQAAQLLQILGRQHGFTVTEVKVASADDFSEFAKMAALAAEGKHTDVIVNYHSPVVGRPGGGHFTPIAGYNSKTKEVLMGEVNLAMNPPFWTHEKILIAAMISQPTNQPRGYLVINWLDPAK